MASFYRAPAAGASNGKQQQQAGGGKQGGKQQGGKQPQAATAASPAAAAKAPKQKQQQSKAAAPAEDRTSPRWAPVAQEAEEIVALLLSASEAGDSDTFALLAGAARHCLLTRSD